MTAIVTIIENVEPYGENLSIVTTREGNQVIANRKEDGSFRWETGEIAVYVSEGSIIPDDVLKERGYWDEEKERGLLDGGKRNRVKMKKLAGFESRGLLFKVNTLDSYDNPDDGVVGWVFRGSQMPELNSWYVRINDDVSDFFDITEFQG